MFNDCGANLKDSNFDVECKKLKPKGQREVFVPADEKTRRLTIWEGSGQTFINGELGRIIGNLTFPEILMFVGLQTKKTLNNVVTSQSSITLINCVSSLSDK